MSNCDDRAIHQASRADWFCADFFLPETRLKTLEEMDELFGAKTSAEEKALVARVHRELGLSAERTPSEITL